jgi:hypothetical protein
MALEEAPKQLKNNKTIILNAIYNEIYNHKDSYNLTNIETKLINKFNFIDKDLLKQLIRVIKQSQLYFKSTPSDFTRDDKILASNILKLLKK